MVADIGKLRWKMISEIMVTPEIIPTPKPVWVLVINALNYSNLVPELLWAVGGGFASPKQESSEPLSSLPSDDKEGTSKFLDARGRISRKMQDCCRGSPT